MSSAFAHSMQAVSWFNVTSWLYTITPPREKAGQTAVQVQLLVIRLRQSSDQDATQAPQSPGYPITLHATGAGTTVMIPLTLRASPKSTLTTLLKLELSHLSYKT
jgi:hypothetical protein